MRSNVTYYTAISSLLFLGMLLGVPPGGYLALAGPRPIPPKAHDKQDLPLPANFVGLEAYQNLRLVHQYMGSNLALTLHHLTQAEKKAPPSLLPFVHYLTGNTHTLSGDYQQALTYYLKTYQNEVWDEQWKDKILGEVFACLFYLGNYDDFMSLFAQQRRRVMGSRALDKVLFFAAQVFEKKSRFESMFQVLEQAASVYPITPTSRHAFNKLVDYTCEESATSSPRYYFSLNLLKSIARNATMDEGIKDFVLASSHDKVRLGSQPPQKLDHVARVDFLFETRFFAEAYALGTTIFNEQPPSPSDPKRQDLLMVMGRLANRLNKHQKAALYFSLHSQESAGDKSALASREFLADALSYGGFPLSASSVYGTLARKTNKGLLRWHHFWTQYTSESTADALHLLSRKPNYVPPRDEAYPLSPRYWQGRLLEKQRQHPQALAAYAAVLAVGGDDIYGNFITRRYPGLVTPSSPGLAPKKTSKLLRPQSSPSLPRQARALGLSKGKHHQELTLSVGLRAAGFPDFSKMLLNKLSPLRLPSSELAGLQEHAQENDAYFLLTQASHKLILLTRPQPRSWEETIAHQEKFSQLWQHYYPRAYSEVLTPISKDLDLDPLLVLSVIRAESNYRETALSYVGARGLMQIMPYTAVQIAKRLGDEQFRLSSLWEPATNITYGSWYLKKLLTYYDNHPALAVAAYNAGPFAVNAWLARCGSCSLDEFIETISYKETRRYVKEVLRHYSRYHRLYEGHEIFTKLPSHLPTTRPLVGDLF